MLTNAPRQNLIAHSRPHHLRTNCIETEPIKLNRIKFDAAVRLIRKKLFLMITPALILDKHCAEINMNALRTKVRALFFL